MVRASAQSTNRGKRAKRRRDADPVYYVVEIEEWDWSFWFGISNAPKLEGHFDDYRHLILSGKLLRPTRLKVDALELSFLPARRLNEDQRQNERPSAVGSFHYYRGRLSGIFSFPADSLPLLLTMATAERLRYVVMQGEKLRYGHAAIKSFRFEMQMTEDDLPPDTE